jgi:hypothetical protein
MKLEHVSDDYQNFSFAFFFSFSLPFGEVRRGFYGTSTAFRISVIISSDVILLASAS